MTTCTTRAAETWAHILAQPDGLHMGYAADYATDDGSEPAEACAAVEAAAQAHLDARPDDHRARRLLGEWLEWHGDVRGEGLRALAACGLFPLFIAWLGTWNWYDRAQRMGLYRNYEADGDDKESDLPSDWFQCLGDSESEFDTTRRAAEDAAALAFARLPAERRAALLRGEM